MNVNDRSSLVNWLLTQNGNVSVAQMTEYVEENNIKLRYSIDERGVKNRELCQQTELDFWFALDTIESLMTIEKALESGDDVDPRDLVTMLKLEFFNETLIKDLTRVILVTVKIDATNSHFWMDTRNGVVFYLPDPTKIKFDHDKMSCAVKADVSRYVFTDDDDFDFSINYRYINDETLQLFMDAVSKVSYYATHPSRICSATTQFSEALRKFIQLKEMVSKWK